MTTLRDATILCYRLTDVADEIDLEKCRALVTAGTELRRLALKREGSAYIRLSNPPLLLELGGRTLKLARTEHEVQVSARIYDHGAISIIMRVPVAAGTSIEGLIPFADELYDSKAVDQLARDELDKLRKALGPGLQAEHHWNQLEEYTVILARDIDGQPTAQQLLAEPNLARLLLGEVKEPRLSSSEEHEVLDHHFSYTDRDLAVIEWNAAFLYEPSGSEDVADLLEIATAQLVELRYYDDVLDRELGRAYDIIGARDTGWKLSSPYKQLLRELMQSLIELSEFIERIENALKIVGDVYLARVYEAAVTQFRVRHWTEQVSRKHKLLQQIYGLLKGDVDTRRALTVEILVVLLILFEIVMALGQVTGH